METKLSLNESLDSAKKHYSSMFFLPSLKKALLALGLICIGGITICSFPLLHSLNSLFLGLLLFATTVLADLATSKLLKSDPVFIIRRILAISFYSWLIWLSFNALGVGFSYFFGWLFWVKLSLIGFAAVVTLRIIVIVAVSYAAKWKQIVFMLLQPLLCITVFSFFWVSVDNTITLQVGFFIVVTPIIAYLAVSFFLSSINRLGKNVYSLRALPLFKAFILNWVTDLAEPLEKQLEEMGENKNIEVTLLKFDSSKPKAAIIVPQVHPGPFKNIGSSLLPSLLKKRYDEEFSCDSGIPLGIFGHELDLASQEQNNKIIAQIISSAKFEAHSALASPVVRVRDGVATASCQIFGDTALLSFSLAPETTEDLPQEIGRIVNEEAKKYDLHNVIVVNTHNSINEIVDTELHLEEIKKAASMCLQKVVALPKRPFRVGSATVFPTEFPLKAGMGTGGITAIIVEVDNQKAAYVIIDGNNMISGLREKILLALDELGFSESEVFTTDTHAVSALVTGRRGYHPVGEVMDPALLIKYIIEVAKKAEAKLEKCSAGYRHFVVPQVRVIGEERLKSVTTLVDKGMEKAKRIIFPIFGIEGLLLFLLLWLF